MGNFQFRLERFDPYFNPRMRTRVISLFLARTLAMKGEAKVPPPFNRVSIYVVLEQSANS